MELADILLEESVIVCSGLINKSDILGKLADRGARVTGADPVAVFETLSQREALGSTGLGNGIAIPHGKLAGIAGVCAVFAKLDHPVEFEAVDDQPVDLLMMLLAPMGSGADHLKALARVARLLRSEEIVDELRRSDNPHEIYKILNRPVPTTKAA